MSFHNYIRFHVKRVIMIMKSHSADPTLPTHSCQRYVLENACLQPRGTTNTPRDQAQQDTIPTVKPTTHCQMCQPCSWQRRREVPEDGLCQARAFDVQALVMKEPEVYATMQREEFVATVIDVIIPSQCRREPSFKSGHVNALKGQLVCW